MIVALHRVACDRRDCSQTGPPARFRVDAWRFARAAGWTLRRQTSEHFCPTHSAAEEATAAAERAAAGLAVAGPVAPALPGPAVELLAQVTGDGLYPMSIYGGPGAIALTVSPADLAHRDVVLERHAISEVARGHMRSTAMSIAEGRVALDAFDRSHRV